jgi:hypothetical protein
MPVLRRRSRGDDEDGEPEAADDARAPGVPAPVPWALGELLREGPAPLVARAPHDPEHLSIALVLGPGQDEPRAAGLPPELARALGRVEGIDLHVVRGEDAEELAAGAGDAGDAARPADVLLAAGWPAAPAVLRTPGARARAVLATTAPAPLADLGWAQAAGSTTDLPVLGPSWMGAGVQLPAGVDKAYVPMPVHRREDMVLVHGDEPFGLLAAAELARRRDDLTFAVSGVRDDLALPFPFLGVGPGAKGLAHAFASAGVALAPAVRGWRPAALAMLVCGQAVVAPDDARARAALGPDTASLAADPIAAADAAEELLADLALRATRARNGFAHVTAGWSATAAALAEALRALP